MGTGTEVVAIISMIISVGSAVYAYNQSPEEQEDTGADVTKQGSQASRNRVYGRCRTSCSNVWSNVNNKNTAKRVDVFTIGGIGTLKSIHQCYIDDKQVFRFPTNDFTIPESTDPTEGIMGHDARVDPITGFPVQLVSLSDKFNKQQVSLQFRMGYKNETAMSLPILYGDGEWTTSHRGDNVPQVCVVANRNIKDEGVVIANDRYTIVVDVTGADVEDENGNLVPSNNSAYSLLDYLTNKEYGLSIPKHYINLQSFAETATFIQDNLLFVNAELKTDASFSDNILNLLSCFGGSLTINNGLITLLYEDLEIPEYSFDKDNILKDSLVVRPATSQNYYNTVTTTYKSQPNDEGEDDYMLPADILNHPDYVTDGEIIDKSIRMPFTIDGIQTEEAFLAAGEYGIRITGPVKFLTNREYRKRLFQKTCSFDIDLNDYPNLQIWSVVEVTEPIYSWDKKLFRILEINSSTTADEFNIATLTMSEYDQFIYTGDDDGTGGGPPDDGPIEPTSPTNITFTQESYVTDGYGTLSWNATYYSISAGYDVQYKLSSEVAWQNVGSIVTKEEIKISNLKPENYDFRVRVNDYINGTSPWASVINITILPPNIIPPVTNLTGDFLTKTAFFSWDSILDEPFGGTGSTDPNSGGSSGTMKDVFSHYLVEVNEYQNTGNINYFAKSYIVTEPKFDYTFDDNSNNVFGASRYVAVNVTVVTISNELSPSEFFRVENSQMPQPSGLDITGEFGQMFVQWDVPLENDYFKTLIYASSVSGFVPAPSNKIGEVLGGSHYNYLFEQTDPNVPETFYIKVVHRDYFEPVNGLVYSPEEIFTTQSIDTLLPEFVDELTAIRDPNREQTTNGEMIMNVASDNKRVVTGFGMYAKDSGSSMFIIAADEFAIATGGYAEWDASIDYVIGDKVSFVVDDLTQSTWEALRSTTGDSPPTSANDWDQIQANSFQSAFYIDTTTEQLLIRNATIQELNASKITVGTFGASVVYGGVITGGQITSDSTIIAGSGNDIAGMDGADATWRFYAGSSYVDRATSPFRVDKDGKLFATGVDIDGKITATSGGVAGWTMDATHIYSGSSPRTTDGYDTNGITLSSDGAIRSKSFRIDANGDAFFKGNITGATGTFSGSIEAGQIIGDIVGGITKTVTNITRIIAGDSSAVVSLSIINARNYDRTLVINSLTLELDNGDGSFPNIVARYVAKNITNSTEVVSASNTVQSNNSERFQTDLIIPIPSNTQPNIEVVIRVDNIDSLNGAGATSTSTDVVALLFKTGGDLA